MRSAVDSILKFNRGFHPFSLRTKLDKMSSSAFVFFRGTFHLFASDVLDGPFRKWPSTATSGQIIGDLHTGNFGTFRSISGEIVYDINDFDETAPAPYEYDIRRLATSLIVAALDNKHALSHGVAAAEACVSGYLDTLGRLAKLKTKIEFERLKERKDVRSVLSSAAERSRVDMLRGLVAESSAGAFVIDCKQNYLPLDTKERETVKQALPRFLKNCIAPENSHPERYAFQDAAFRIAGCGSLGRQRYAILLGKAKGGKQTLSTLRIVEWKDSLDSSLVVPRPRQSKNRARDILQATLAFQLLPKRYLGFTAIDRHPMQAREIGANDARFQHKEFRDAARFLHAARIFGEITARAHLISTLGKKGPRALLRELAGRQDRWVNRLVAFAVAYTDRTLDDYQEFLARRSELGEKWALTEPRA
ncbi:MAG: DUF2252 family protein [Bryobacteraceae bacterium]